MTMQNMWMFSIPLILSVIFSGVGLSVIFSVASNLRMENTKFFKDEKNAILEQFNTLAIACNKIFDNYLSSVREMNETISQLRVDMKEVTTQKNMIIDLAKRIEENGIELEREVKRSNESMQKEITDLKIRFDRLPIKRQSDNSEM